MTKIRENEAIVTRVSEQGVTIQTAEQSTVVSWDTMRAAASQDDVGAATLYRSLLDVAMRMARDTKKVTVCLVDRTGTGLSTACEVYYTLSGEFAPRWAGVAGAADGGTTIRRQAEIERDECVAKLRSRGFVVRTDA